jgi:hypothetical protein
MRRYYDDLVTETTNVGTPLFSTPPALLPYLNAAFFRRINGYLDQAEKLCAGAGDEKYVRNVRFERVPVDSGMLYLWHRFAGQPGFERREAVIERYHANKKALYARFPHAANHGILYGTRLADEVAALALPVPAQFRGRRPNLRAATCIFGLHKKPVADPDAAGGSAVRLGNPGDKHQLPFLAKIHDNAAREDFVPIFRLNEFPSDGRYHWYKINTIGLTSMCGLWSKVYIWVPLNWAVLPPPENKVEVHVSLKFTGPTYVPGSAGPDEVRLDRIAVVRPEVAAR